MCQCSCAGNEAELIPDDSETSTTRIKRVPLFCDRAERIEPMGSVGRERKLDFREGIDRRLIKAYRGSYEVKGVVGRK